MLRRGTGRCSVDLLLREAQQLGCGVFDEDLEELLGELQPTAGGE